MNNWSNERNKMGSTWNDDLDGSKWNVSWKSSKSHDVM